MMAKMIFVNLPVTDLAASTRFYEAIGFWNSRGWILKPWRRSNDGRTTPNWRS